MGFRITTNMMMNTYRFNLMQNTGQLSSSRDKVLTQRNFNSYAEDPAAATHAWRLRRSLTQTESYRTSNTEAYTRFNTAWITLKSIDDNIVNGPNNEGGVVEAIKRADDDPTGGARTALGKVLSDFADSVVFGMNGAKYGDHFVFAGNDEMKAPFTWSGNKLLYRGINVNAGSIPPADKQPDWGKMIPADTPKMDDSSLTSLEKAWVDYYRNDGLNPLNHTPDWVADYKKYLEDMDAYTKGAGGEEPPKMPDMPEKMSALDDAWMEYLDGYPTTPLDDAKNPSLAANDPSANWGPNTAPADMPEDSKKLVTSWEKAWYAYYDDQRNGGVNGVPSPAAQKLTDLGYDWIDPATGKPIEGKDIPPVDEGKDPLEQAWLEYFHDQRDLSKLEAMMNETKDVDLGMGFLEDTGNRDLIQSTAFNRALPGIAILGYGVDEDGDPKNIACIMKRLSEIYSHCDEKTGEFATKAEREEAYRLLGKFNTAHDKFNEAYSDVNTQAEFLQSNGTRLKDQEYNIKEQIAEVEQVDLADAIQDFSWAYYCYSSALKIGTQLLSQSLIDYMR